MKNTLQNELKNEATAFLASNDAPWISLLDSEGIPWQGLTEERMQEKTFPSTIILPKQSSKSFVNYCYNAVLNGTSLLVEPGVFSDRNTEELLPLTFSFEKANFLGLMRSTVVRIRSALDIVNLKKALIFYLPFSLAKYWENWQRSRRFVIVGDNEVYL